MSSHSDNGRTGCIPDDEELLARLFQTAGSREEPPREAYDEVLAAATAAWQDKVRRTRRRRWAYAMAASAAFAAIIAGLVLRQSGPAHPPVEVASSDRSLGRVAMLSAGESDWRELEWPGRPVFAGSRLRTGGDSGAGLLMGRGVSFRMDESTEVRFESPTRIHLVSGAVYLDANPRLDRTSPIEIVTRIGTARHVGTQFELRYKDGGLRLRVREGLVMLRHEETDVPAEAGVQLSVDSSGDVRETTVTRQDPGWDWVQALAPDPAGSDPSLTALLEWVERESGREVHFATPELREKAARTILHGSRDRLLPMEALAVMLETTDFQYTVASDSEILIEERRY